MAGAHTYALSTWLFLRVLAFIYFAAFISLAPQIRGLIGSTGVVPAIDQLNRYRSGGIGRVSRFPTLLWLNSSDSFLSGVCWAGAALSTLLMVGFAPVPILFFLWLLYLSLFTASGPFLGYQWDILLLEAGFIAMFIAPADILPRFPPMVSPSPIGVALLWWLLFRLMWSSGVSKILSGERRWRDLSAVAFHYETQPLPTPLAWHIHQLPLWFHRASTAFVLAIELAVPFFIIIPALRPVAAVLFIILMLLIELTGNYAFFNLLGIALCIPLFSDASLAPFLGVENWHPAAASAVAIGVSVVPGTIILLLSVVPMTLLFHREINWPGPFADVISFLTPFRLVNSYGLFSIMTIERPEIVIEASNDGVQWIEYEFKYKPGDVKRVPLFVAPHQPRLDWQMWFAAIGFYHNHMWIKRLMFRLMDGDPAVRALLKLNPFQKDRPRYIRAVLYDYRFTTRSERQSTGAWWRRERRGLYGPMIER
jgi:lipase maturation factor 1